MMSPLSMISLSRPPLPPRPFLGLERIVAEVHRLASYIADILALKFVGSILTSIAVLSKSSSSSLRIYLLLEAVYVEMGRSLISHSSHMPYVYLRRMLIILVKLLIGREIFRR